MTPKDVHCVAVLPAAMHLLHEDDGAQLVCAFVSSTFGSTREVDWLCGYTQPTTSHSSPMHFDGPEPL